MDRIEHECTEPSPIDQTTTLAALKDQLLESLVDMMSEKMSQMRDDMLKQFEECVGAEACNDSDKRIIQQQDVEPQSKRADTIQDYLKEQNAEDALNSFDGLAAEFSTATKQGHRLMKN